MEAKRQTLKKGVDAEAGRRRRGESAIQLRKSQKEEGLAKRRNMQQDYQADDVSKSLVVTDGKQFNCQSSHSDLLSADPVVQLAAIKQYRRALSVEKNPPVQECLESGAITSFIRLLQRTDYPEIQFEAAWALTNVASTEHTKVVAKLGGIPPLVQLLTSPVPDVREQAAWCLGNIAGDGSELRDIVLRSGGLGPLIANIAEPASLSLLRNCTWALSNFCRGKPQPELNEVYPAVQALGLLLKNTTDSEVKADAAWALSYLSDGDNSRIQAIVEQNIVASLVEMLTHERAEMIIPSLRTLGNIVTGSDSQTQTVLNSNGSLSNISRMLCHSKKNIRKEACWLLSNVAAGNKNQIAQLVQTPGLISNVLLQLSESSEWDVRKESAWVICNIASGGSKENICHLVENGALKPLCDLLSVGESRVLLLALEALENILKAGMSTNLNFAQLIDEADGISKLELLQEHENHEVYDKSVKIIEKYFCGEGEDEAGSENVAPQSNASNFAFGISQSLKQNEPSKQLNVFQYPSSSSTNVFNFSTC